MTEQDLHAMVCQYIRTQYTNVIFNSDMAGVKLTIGQAKRSAKLRSSKGFPDIVIYEPRGGFHGLFLELKRDGVRIYNRYGEPATEHIKEQHKILCKLDSLNYAAYFACGFDQAKQIIDEYLSEK